MLSALGVKFTDVNGDLLQMNGANLAHIAQIDITNLDSRLKEVTFKVACDVSNPLLGENGATYIYGPQKGANAKMIPKLDFAMSHYHDKIKMCTGKSVNQIPGSGAAGGMGAALLAFCETTLTKVLMSSLTLQIFIKELKMQTSLLLEKDAWIIRPSLAKHRRRCVSCKTISYSCHRDLWQSRRKLSTCLRFRY